MFDPEAAPLQVSGMTAESGSGHIEVETAPVVAATTPVVSPAPAKPAPAPAKPAPMAPVKKDDEGKGDTDFKTIAMLAGLLLVLVWLTKKVRR